MQVAINTNYSPLLHSLIGTSRFYAYFYAKKFIIHSCFSLNKYLIGNNNTVTTNQLAFLIKNLIKNKTDRRYIIYSIHV